MEIIMTNKVLVKFESNWADEMDVCGFAVMSSDEWNKVRQIILLIKDEFSISVGTNEEIEYENGQELLDEYEVCEISDDESQIIQRLFGHHYGYFRLDSEEVVDLIKYEINSDNNNLMKEVNKILNEGVK